MKYSITRALAELKLLKNRYNKEVQRLSLIAVKRGMKIRPPYTSFKEEDFIKTAESQYQSIIALRRRMDEIKLAIDKSNFETTVKIGDKEGEITNVLGIGYEITFFDINLGKTFIDSRDIYDYLI